MPTMRRAAALVTLWLLAGLCEPGPLEAWAQTDPTAGSAQIGWDVKSGLRLFRNEAIFCVTSPRIAATGCLAPRTGWRATAMAAAGPQISWAACASMP